MMLKVYYKYSTVLNHKNDVTLERYKLMRSRYHVMILCYGHILLHQGVCILCSVILTSSIQAQLLNLKLHNASGHCNSDSAMLA